MTINKNLLKAASFLICLIVIVFMVYIFRDYYFITAQKLYQEDKLKMCRDAFNEYKKNCETQKSPECEIWEQNLNEMCSNF